VIGPKSRHVVLYMLRLAFKAVSETGLEVEAHFRLRWD
jgi:hypothetical protein